VPRLVRPALGGPSSTLGYPHLTTWWGVRVQPCVFIRGWPTDDERAEAWDLVCRECGEWSRMNPGDGFVPQVRVFLSQHRHGEVDFRDG
jgi:hypothetical protein